MLGQVVSGRVLQSSAPMLNHVISDFHIPACQVMFPGNVGDRHTLVTNVWRSPISLIIVLITFGSSIDSRMLTDRNILTKALP